MNKIDKYLRESFESFTEACEWINQKRPIFFCGVEPTFCQDKDYENLTIVAVSENFRFWLKAIRNPNYEVIKKTKERMIVYRVTAPGAITNGYGCDDARVKDFGTYEEAQNFIINCENKYDLRIDKIFINSAQETN